DKGAGLSRHRTQQGARSATERTWKFGPGPRFFSHTDACGACRIRVSSGVEATTSPPPWWLPGLAGRPVEGAGIVPASRTRTFLRNGETRKFDPAPDFFRPCLFCPRPHQAAGLNSRARPDGGPRILPSTKTGSPLSHVMCTAEWKVVPVSGDHPQR